MALLPVKGLIACTLTNKYSLVFDIHTFFFFKLYDSAAADVNVLVM